jgi:hypothetical protein
MVKPNIELLFDKIIEGSYKLNKTKKNFDGQKFWQPIKKICNKFDEYELKKWKKTTLSKLTIHKIMSLSEYMIDGYGNKNIDLVNHFIIQQIRIPLQEKATIRKIMQIALNIGLYRGKINNKFLYNVKFDNINQFVSKKDIEELNKHITNSIVMKIDKYIKSCY